MQPWRTKIIDEVDNLNIPQIINIFDLKDTDKKYLNILIIQTKEALIKYFKKLGFIIFNDNIIIYIHMPVGGCDIHFQIKIFLNNAFQFIIENESTSRIYELNRFWHTYKIIELLQLKKNFFEEFNFTALFEDKLMIKVIKHEVIIKVNDYLNNTEKVDKLLEDTKTFDQLSEEIKQLLINKDSNQILKKNPRLLIEPRFISLIYDSNNTNRIIQDGGNNNLKFIKWINKYININHILHIYQIPKININFKIKKSNKNIHSETLYNKYLICPNIFILTIENTFFKYFTDKYFNIAKDEYYINIFEKIFFKKFINILFINNLYITKYDIFYFDDNQNPVNLKDEYKQKYYDFIKINSTLEFSKIYIDRCKTHLHLKKNITALIWALNHLDTNGVIMLFIRETLIPSSFDLILLLSQFCDVKLYYDYIIIDAFVLKLNLICSNFRNTSTLIQHLETILTFENSPNLSFLEITEIKQGNLEKFTKQVLKPSKFIINRQLEYIECFKNDKGEFEAMPEEIKDIIKMKTIMLATQSFIPKPESIPYIYENLFLNKMKVSKDKYIEVFESFTKKEAKIIFKLIKKCDAHYILELGMGYAQYTIILLQILNYYNSVYNLNRKNFKLTSVDQYQKSKWKNIGVKNVEKIELEDHHKLIKEKSTIALPILIKDLKMYDIIFLTGWYKFDYMLFDLLNAYELLKIDGFIIINDISLPGIEQLIKFIENNYESLKRIEVDSNKIAVYQKKFNDTNELSRLKRMSIKVN